MGKHRLSHVPLQRVREASVQLYSFTTASCLRGERGGGESERGDGGSERGRGGGERGRESKCDRVQVRESGIVDKTERGEMIQ